MYKIRGEKRKTFFTRFRARCAAARRYSRGNYFPVRIKKKKKRTKRYFIRAKFRKRAGRVSKTVRRHDTHFFFTHRTFFTVKKKKCRFIPYKSLRTRHNIYRNEYIFFLYKIFKHFLINHYRIHLLQRARMIVK